MVFSYGSLQNTWKAKVSTPIRRYPKYTKISIIRIHLKKYSTKYLLSAADTIDKRFPTIYARNVVFDFAENIHNFLFDIQFMSFIL